MHNTCSQNITQAIYHAVESVLNESELHLSESDRIELLSPSFLTNAMSMALTQLLEKRYPSIGQIMMDNFG
jgi:hypothetical protein